MGSNRNNKRPNKASEKEESAKKSRKKTNDATQVHPVLAEISLSLPVLRWQNLFYQYIPGNYFCTQSLTQIEAIKYSMTLNARTDSVQFKCEVDVDDPNRLRIIVNCDDPFVKRYQANKDARALERKELKVANFVNYRMGPNSTYELASIGYHNVGFVFKPEYLPSLKDSWGTHLYLPGDEIIITHDILHQLNSALWDCIPIQNNKSPLLYELGCNWAYPDLEKDGYVYKYLYTYAMYNTLFNPLYALANYKYERFQLVLAQGACEGIFTGIEDSDEENKARIRTSSGIQLFIPRDVSRLIGSFLFFQRADVSSLPLVCQAARTKANELVNNEGTDIPQQEINKFKASVAQAPATTQRGLK